MQSTLARAGAILCAALTSSVALAGEAAPRTVSVRTGDLELATPAGRRALERRIRAAAREVCGDPSPLVRGGPNAALQCRAATAIHASAQHGLRIALSGGVEASIPR